MPSRPRKPRVLVIEDEFLIAVTVKEMLEHLGCDVIGPIATWRGAISQCATVDADAAVLSLILEGQEVYPVAAILAARNVPFGFASGTDHAHTNPGWAGRPFLSKPHTMAGLRAFLFEVLPDHKQPD